MRLQWSELLAAFALVCILEGVMPFVHPAALKRLLLRLSTTGERELRLVGFCSILAGLLILFLVRS